MSKQLTRQQNRLARRVKAHNEMIANPKHDEGIFRRIRTGGYHKPGSMNHHKSAAAGRKRP